METLSPFVIFYSKFGSVFYKEKSVLAGCSMYPFVDFTFTFLYVTFDPNLYELST